MADIHFLDPNSQGSPAVLLLHGLGANSQSWAMQFDALSEAGMRPLAVDVPGFGQSPYDGSGWHLPRIAADLAALVRKLDVGPVHVVGLSMGGVIAQQFALDFPNLTRKLVLVNTFAVLRPKTLSGWVYFLSRSILIHTFGLCKQADLVARRVFPHPHQDALRQMYIQQVMQADPRAYRAAMRALGFCNLTPRLPELRLPVLVITGANDITVPPDRQRQLAEAIPGARQVIIQGAGHAVSVEQAGEFNQVLIAFLTD
ncbi:MAG: alpha/beta fold hydrolase [Anaerolineales bacterium]